MSTEGTSGGGMSAKGMMRLLASCLHAATPGAGAAGAVRAKPAALVLAVLLLVLAVLPSSLPTLDWERSLLLQGQVWRLFTGHLVHLGWLHLGLNLAGLLLLAELFWDDLSLNDALGLLLASSLTVSLGLLLAAPGLTRYAGLSGVLHGAWAGSAMLLLLRRECGERDTRLWWALALLAVVAKLVSESLQGPGPLARQLGATVVTQSHALGALGGMLWALLASQAPRLLALAGRPAFD